jgi:hypothetical protein
MPAISGILSPVLMTGRDRDYVIAAPQRYAMA